MIDLLLQILVAFWAFVLPGTLLCFGLQNDWTPGLRIAVGVALSVLCVPMLCFCAAWLVGTSVTLDLVAAVASLANIATGLGVLWHRRRPWANPPRAR